jgi:DMSO/TMAO reductase YedYZ heme-binding membrane subunit
VLSKTESGGLEKFVRALTNHDLVNDMMHLRREITVVGFVWTVGHGTSSLRYI